MERIKFRGKSVEDNSVHFGCLVKKSFCWFIHERHDVVEIMADSIEQMVGLDDNDDELYEGDSIIVEHGLVSYSGRVVFDNMAYCIEITHSSEGVGIPVPEYDIGEIRELNNFDSIFIKEEGS